VTNDDGGFICVIEVATAYVLRYPNGRISSTSAVAEPRASLLMR